MRSSGDRLAFCRLCEGFLTLPPGRRRLSLSALAWGCCSPSPCCCVSYIGLPLGFLLRFRRPLLAQGVIAIVQRTSVWRIASAGSCRKTETSGTGIRQGSPLLTPPHSGNSSNFLSVVAERPFEPRPRRPNGSSQRAVPGDEPRTRHAPSRSYCNEGSSCQLTSGCSWDGGAHQWTGGQDC